jgi:hypothetical protein
MREMFEMFLRKSGGERSEPNKKAPRGAARQHAYFLCSLRIFLSIFLARASATFRCRSAILLALV